MLWKLKVKNVVTMDFRAVLGRALLASTRCSRRPASRLTHISAPNTTTKNYQAYMTKVPSNADIVFFPTQKPGDARRSPSSCSAKGQEGQGVGSDGWNDPTQFKVPGSYVSDFAAPINLFPYDKPIIAGWMKATLASRWARSGRPTYGADPDHPAGGSRSPVRSTTA